MISTWMCAPRTGAEEHRRWRSRPTLTARQRLRDHGAGMSFSSGRLGTVVTALLVLCLPLSAPAQEEIISKADADRIFGMNRPAWEAHAKLLAPPSGWTMRLLPQSTGTGFAAYDPATGMGLSVQPLYPNDNDPPDMIVVGSWYPAGRLRFTPERVAEIERAAQRDLGPGYTVSASTTRRGEIEGVELLVRRERATLPRS